MNNAHIKLLLGELCELLGHHVLNIDLTWDELKDLFVQFSRNRGPEIPKERLPDRFEYFGVMLHEKIMRYFEQGGAADSHNIHSVLESVLEDGPFY